MTIMKFRLRHKTILGAALVFLFTPKSIAQKELTPSQWQEDVRFLQKKVHKDYPFLFKKVTAKKFDEEVEKFHGQIPTLENHEIKVGLARVVSLFEYGHTQIPFSTLAEEAVLAVNLYHFEDGIFIEGVRKVDEKALGAKVIAIGGTPIQKALKAIRPVVPTENEQYFKAYGLRFLTVPSVLHAQGVITSLSNTINLTLEKDGELFEHEFSTVPLSGLSRNYGFTVPNEDWMSVRIQDKTPLFLKHLNERLYFFEFLPDTKTLYVRQSSVFNDEKESLQEFYNRLFLCIDDNEIEKLVYDVRLNGGGNNFNNRQFIKGIMARPKINTKGKFFFIIGRNTFSACQNLTNEIENYTEAILVGEPTAENKNFYGDNRKVTLPNSAINAYLSHAWWQDVTPWENKEWTAPHIAVEMTSEDYKGNYDPVLEAALKYTETGFILNPMDHITQLFIAGKFDQLKKDGHIIANDPSYKHYDFKEDISTTAFNLLQNGNTKDGLYVLELITEFYPKSIGSLYNLASALEQADQLEKAKENYKKLMTLDPDSMLGKSARSKLENLDRP